MKQAVLFAMPGTSLHEAGRTLDRIDQMFERRFPGIRALRAYTSSGVRRKLALSGAPADSPSESLARLRSEGYTCVAVKPLHLVPGMEYTEIKDLVRNVRSESGWFERIVISSPLLEAPDLERTMRCLVTALSAGTAADAALLLVAHGSRQKEAQSAYEKAAVLCRRLDRRVLFGAMMSRPGLEDVIRECRDAGIRKLTLAPLMIVAGLSARNELAGSEPTSWASTLEREGIHCETTLRGLGDHDEIVGLWLDDVKRMLTELSGSSA